MSLKIGGMILSLLMVNKKSKENEELKNQELSKNFVGKYIYLKIEPNTNNTGNYEWLSPSDRQKWKNYYDNPIKFEIFDFKDNRAEIKYNLLKIKTNFKGFFNKMEHCTALFEDKYNVDIRFEDNQIIIDGGGSRSYLSIIQYIPKESAITLFNLNKKLYPNFKPQMNSILETSGGLRRVIPIKE